MSREQQVTDILKGNQALLDIMTGGIYSDQEAGIEGIHRGDDSTTENAFDENGNLKPCILVRQDGQVPYGTVRNLKQKFVATSQMVRVYFYQRRGHALIEEAKELVYGILEGYKLEDAYPIWFEYETPYLYDGGPVSNSTVCRQDWQCISIRGN